MARVSDEYALKLLDQITGPLKRIEQQAAKVAKAGGPAALLKLIG